MLLLFALILIFCIIITINIKIVSQSQSFVVERLGSYHITITNGVNILIPFIDKIVKKISLKEQIIDFLPQPVITKDNVIIQIDSVVYYQITDPKLYTYGAENPLIAIENLTATTLRNLIGEIEFDATLTSRDTINNKLRIILDEATDPWGIKINRVELKNIVPPIEVQNSMEKEMKAERERRAAILKAEGEKKSAILRAEGMKEAAILEAEGQKEAAILRASASKERTILEAEGEKEAIKMLKDSNIDKNVLAIKGIEAFVKASNGNATKIIVPSNLQNIASLTEIFNNPQN